MGRLFAPDTASIGATVRQNLRDGEVQVPGRHGLPETIARVIRRFNRLATHSASGSGATTILRRPHKAALLRLNARFAAAIDNLAQGLVILDRDHRLIVNNRRLYDFYPVSGPPFAMGTELRDIIARNVANGHHPDCTAEQLYCDMRARLDLGVRFSFRHALPSGLLIQAQWQRLPDLSWVGTYEDITEQQQSSARIAHMTRHDGLTDLVNRDGFCEAITRAAARTRRGDAFAVLAVRLDRFTKITDTLGHGIGNALLREAASRLCRSVREADEVGRLGGEEFAILQTAAEPPDGAESLARRIIEVLSLPFTIEGNDTTPLGF